MDFLMWWISLLSDLSSHTNLFENFHRSFDVLRILEVGCSCLNNSFFLFWGKTFSFSAFVFDCWLLCISLLCILPNDLQITHFSFLFSKLLFKMFILFLLFCLNINLFSSSTFKVQAGRQAGPVWLTAKRMCV